MSVAEHLQLLAAQSSAAAAWAAVAVYKETLMIAVVASLLNLAALFSAIRVPLLERTRERVEKRIENLRRMRNRLKMCRVGLRTAIVSGRRVLILTRGTDDFATVKGKIAARLNNIDRDRQSLERMLPGQDASAFTTRQMFEVRRLMLQVERNIKKLIEENGSLDVVLQSEGWLERYTRKCALRREYLVLINEELERRIAVLEKFDLKLERAGLFRSLRSPSFTSLPSYNRQELEERMSKAESTE